MHSCTLWQRRLAPTKVPFREHLHFAPTTDLESAGHTATAIARIKAGIHQTREPMHDYALTSCADLLALWHLESDAHAAATADGAGAEPLFHLVHVVSLA